MLEENLINKEKNSPAVILDIDETILDNSPQTAGQIREGRPFSDELWDEWVALAQARALPGALEFVNGAASKGVEVYYISNRGIHQLEQTLANLRKEGFPFADSTHVLLKTGTEGKDMRRAKVASSHEILLLIGDNLGDFSGIYDKRSSGSAKLEVRENKELFGSRYIVLPNPMYGSWEKPFRSDDENGSLKMKKEALRAYLSQKE